MEGTLVGGDTTGRVGRAKELSVFPGRGPVLQSEQLGAAEGGEGLHLILRSHSYKAFLTLA